MDESQYIKLKKKLGIRKCPICRQQVIYCDFNRVSLFNKEGKAEPFETVQIPKADYIEFECPNCSYVMKFNIGKLLI